MLRNQQTRDCLSNLRRRTPGQKEGDPFLDDERPKEITDELRWIDAEVMIADPLTEIMDPVKLVRALETNQWNVEQLINSVIVEEATQLQRRKTTAENLFENRRKVCRKPGEYYVGQNLVIISHDASKIKANDTHRASDLELPGLRNQDDGRRPKRPQCTKT